MVVCLRYNVTPIRRPSPRQPEEGHTGTATERLLRLIARAAADAVPCPTNWELADALHIHSLESARALIMRLRDEGQLIIEYKGTQVRRFRLPGTGLTTGWTVRSHRANV